ncbi:type II secretion system protein [Prosthecobacter sp.]|jgi:prepilin-type N-terminal cleavage/methylation domain-containing protein|uniref:type II secretion system protein n=1 Tax=Prosthecobacter sp. TaxID=1965333 RepID=UPI0037849AD9
MMIHLPDDERRRCRRAAFSLIELVTVLMILGVMTSVIVLRMEAEQQRQRDKRHAQAIVQSYSLGSAARVPWPPGNVATVVAAVVEGRKPREGAFAHRLFVAAMSAADARRTYRYLGRRPDGTLFYDPTGAQDPEGW